jgi:PAT family beta-lactamase induction signal transducer AmpG
MKPIAELPIDTRATEAGQANRNPWRWVPSLYLAEGLPYAVVMFVSVIMYKGLGITNTDVALYTSWLYLPWVIKPLWSPVVDILKTRRQWIWVMQLLVGAGLAGVALTIPAPNFFRYSLAFLWLLAFSSATHDIAADGFYMLATTEKEQAFFVGIRSTFYRLAMISGQGLLVMLAGFIQTHTGLPKVEIEVAARPAVAAVAPALPGQDDSSISDKLHIVVTSANLEIDSQPRPKADIATLLRDIKQRNIQNGFYAEEPAVAKNPSWWTRSVSRPLADRLRVTFRKKNAGKTDMAGNVSVAELKLSAPPPKPIIVTLAWKRGDKSIAVAEGGRLTFNQDNWNKPASVAFQVDPRLSGSSVASYAIRSGNIALSWTITFAVLVGLFLFFGVYHRFILPHPAKDAPGTVSGVVTFLREFLNTFGAFFSKNKIGVLLLFLLFYRFAEAQLVKMVAPFLLDPREAGGLGLTTGQVGFVYGAIGIIALTCGGLLGGMLVSKHGLKFWLWPMVFIMHLPDATFLYLAYAQPQNFFLINLCVAVEQFGYGFGFTAYMLYMIYIARGKHETAHYAICTGFMALGMMLPGMFSGWLQEVVGYRHFFLWVLLATLPGFAVVAFVPLDPEFGKKTTRE